MGVEVIHFSEQLARRDYPCQACEFILIHVDSLEDVPYRLKRALVLARRQDWKIKKGQKYLRQYNKDGGHTWTFRCIPEMHEICQELDLYYE